MTVTSTKSAEHYTWGAQCDGWHLVKSESLSVIQERVPAGASESHHYHKKSEQFFYILSGIATMEVGGQLLTVRANEGIHIPAGTTHMLSNCGSADLVFTVTSTPPSHGDRVEV